MAQPYSTKAEVLGKVLSDLTTKAGWADADFTAVISEADNEIDSRLSGMGYALPFGVNNPPLVKQLSILYARHAIFRDTYTGVAPSDKEPSAAKQFLDQFESKLEALNKGWTSLVDAYGNVIYSGKFDVGFATNDAPETEPVGELISTYVERYDAQDSAVTTTKANDAFISSADGTYNEIVSTNPSVHVERWATDALQLLYYTLDTNQGVNGWIVIG